MYMSPHVTFTVGTGFTLRREQLDVLFISIGLDAAAPAVSVSRVRDTSFIDQLKEVPPTELTLSKPRSETVAGLIGQAFDLKVAADSPVAVFVLQTVQTNAGLELAPGTTCHIVVLNVG
jgi:hypothetical protein